MPRQERQEDVALSRLRGWLATGRWRTGDRLPSERELAAEIGVNRKAVHASLERLVREQRLQEVSPRVREVCPLRPGPGGAAAPLVLLSLAATDLGYFQSPMVVDLHAAAQQSGYHVLCLAPQAIDAAGARRLVEIGTPGVVLLTDGILHEQGPAAVRHLVAAGLRVAVHADALAPEDVPAGALAVRSDHAVGGRLLTRFCLQQGRRRILRFWDLERRHEPVPHWLRERDRGTTESLREAGIEPLPGVDPLRLPVVRPAEFDRRAFERGVRMCAGFLVERIAELDAILCASDRDALSVVAACRLLGRNPHHDVAVLGYDNHWSQQPELPWTQKPLATAEKDGPALVEALLALASGTARTVRERRVSPRLVVLG